MVGLPLHEMTPWNRRPLTIPPDTAQAWLRLAVWEFWTGVLLCGILGFGTLLIVTAPNRIITVRDLTSCYAPPPVAQPCERIVYRTGALNAVFTVSCGVLMFVLAAWFLWELWSTAAPKPITDDFLKLLHDSFARKWRDPRTWPWARLGWAYGFTLLGATLTAGGAAIFWTFLTSSDSAKAPAVTVETSEIFRVGG
jgi:hypothetical protein